MMIIYKYQFGIKPAIETLPEFGKPFTMNVPPDARFLSFQTQLGVPTMWMQLGTSPRYDKIRRNFMLVMTGQEFTAAGLEFLGTCQLILQAGNFVLHLYGEKGIKA